jgi:hypothetical protein
MVIHQLCYAVAKKMAIGWPGPNRDLSKDTVLLLSKRHGRTTFVHVELRAKNDRKQEAYSLAKAALEVPQLATFVRGNCSQYHQMQQFSFSSPEYAQGGHGSRGNITGKAKTVERLGGQC